MEETRKQWPPIQAAGLYPDITHSTFSAPEYFVTELPFSSCALSAGKMVRRVGTWLTYFCKAAHKIGLSGTGLTACTTTRDRAPIG